MGRWKAFIPIFLALVIAAGGSYFLYNWLQQRTAAPDTARKVEAETFPVVVAAVDLPWGTKLDNPEQLLSVPYLKQSIPNGSFSDPAKLMGRVVVSPIKASEPILEYRLASEDIKTGGIAAVVKKGMRAVSVAGNKVAGIAGFINPGNRVDVMVTTNDPKTKKETTKLVLDNVLVLAAGTQVRESPEGKPSPVDVFTLELTPIQAEQIAIAANKGRLQFTLRNMLDAETVLTEGATIEETLALLRGPEVEIDIPKPKPPKPAAPPPVKKRVIRRAPVQKSVVVEVIKGDKVGRQTFKK